MGRRPSLQPQRSKTLHKARSPAIPRVTEPVGAKTVQPQLKVLWEKRQHGNRVGGPNLPLPNQQLPVHPSPEQPPPSTLAPAARSTAAAMSAWATVQVSSSSLPSKNLAQGREIGVGAGKGQRCSPASFFVVERATRDP